MPSPKIIAVVGATGLQGSSVAKTFLAQPNWHVRCLTRTPVSAKAQELVAQGAEVVQADLSDLESLERAFSGAHAIFTNTDFWIPYQRLLAEGNDRDTSRKISYDTELLHAKNAAIAAAGVSTLERFVYSALGPMSEASGGKYPHSYHWETKAAAVKYIEKEQPELAKKTSYIYLGAYSNNQFLRPQRDPETGRYTLLFPAAASTKLPIVDPATSTGPFVHALIENEAPGTKLLAYDSNLSMAEAMQAWIEVSGQEAEFVQMTQQEMHEVTGLPYEVLDAPVFLSEHAFTAGIEGVILPGQLKKRVKTRSYAQFLKSQDKDFLLGSEYPAL